MRRICYAVAASLDGYIAGPNGEADWIVMDPEIDFGALFRRFDTVLLGRKTFEATLTMGGGAAMPGVKTVVVSRTLRPEDHPKITVIGENVEAAITRLKAEPGKDIWLFGGGYLFGSLLDAKLVDTVEVAVVPVLLGGGIALLPPPAARAKLELTGHRVYKTGIVSLEYAVKPARAKRPAQAGKRKPKQ
jgi:dihydrofolate reductase